MRAFSVGGAPPRGNRVGGRAAARTLDLQGRDLRGEEEIQQACHELEELRCAYDGVRAEIALIIRDETGRDGRRNFDDGPDGYAPRQCRERLTPQRRRFDGGYGRRWVCSVE